MHQREARLEHFPQLDELGAVGCRGSLWLTVLQRNAAESFCANSPCLARQRSMRFGFSLFRKVTIMITMRENEAVPRIIIIIIIVVVVVVVVTQWWFRFVSVRFGNGTNALGDENQGTVGKTKHQNYCCPRVDSEKKTKNRQPFGGRAMVSRDERANEKSQRARPTSAHGEPPRKTKRRSAFLSLKPPSPATHRVLERLRIPSRT